MVNCDLINGLFEVAGGLSSFNNVRFLVRDKAVRGVSIKSTALFFSWGIWNLYYFPTLHQIFSFLGGLIIVIGNCFWLVLALYYSYKNKVMSLIT